MSQIQKSKEDEPSALVLVFKGLLFVWKLSVQLMFFPFKRPLTHVLDLEQYAAYWSRWGWLYLSIKWFCAFAFIKTAFPVLGHFLGPKISALPLADVIANIFIAFLSGLVFNVFEWIGQYARDPNIQRRLAGIAAEEYVQTLIDNSSSYFPNVQTLHGQLFVFNADTSNEYSVEADHIVITERNIFVIETKCKSGTISARADSARWTVSSKHGDGEMQNALKQAKNAARVLHRQANLPCELIPLVAIKGNEVQILDGPSNVSAAENIVEIMRAFEQSKPHPKLDPASIQSLLATYIKSDAAAMERHIERAQAARKRAEQAEIVEAASIQ